MFFLCVRVEMFFLKRSSETYFLSILGPLGFLGLSPLNKHSLQDNVSLQNVNWHPPKHKSLPSKKGLATSNLQFLYSTTLKSPLPNFHFGGCQFAFWRLKLSWGCFIL